MVAACGSSEPNSALTSPPPAATTAPSASPSASGSPAGIPSPTCAAGSPAAQVVAVPPVLGEQVAGLTTTTAGTQTAGRSVETIVTPGAPSLAAAAEKLSGAAVHRFGDSPSRGSGDGLSISWAPVLTAGPVLGLRMLAEASDGDAPRQQSSRSLYTDVTSGRTWIGANLIAAPERVAEVACQALAAAGVSAAPTPGDVVGDPRFGADSALTVVLPSSVVPGTDASASDPVAVRLDPELTTEVLSPAGKQVLAASVAAQPFQGIPAPKPTPASVDCHTHKCVALTYDDGPGPYTERLLRELKARKTKATFFLLGRNSAGWPRLVDQMESEGHVVGNHSWSHANLTRLTPAGITDELDRANRAIEQEAGNVTLMRPPYGATNLNVTKATRGLGLAQIMWSVDAFDWQNRDAAKTTDLAMKGVRAGSIILMHDIHPSTVTATPGIIDGLRSRGFTLVTVPQLLGSNLKPGNRYFSQHDRRAGPVEANPRTATPVPSATPPAAP